MSERKICSTCGWLGIPEGEDHAKYYRECRWTTPMPSNVLQLERALYFDNTTCAARCITRKIIEEKQELLNECPVWKPAITEKKK